MLVTHNSSDPKASRVSITLASGLKSDLYIEANVELDSKADAWLFLLLPICMQLGEDLEIVGELSASAVEAFHRAKKELLRGHPKMKDIQLIFRGEFVDTQVIEDKTRQTGLFFSGGLDSTYAAETQTDIETLIAVWGFDIPISNDKHWDLTVSLLEPYVRETNRKFILVETNIRTLSNGLLEWGGDYHGTALSGVANSLANHLSKVYVSAGFVRVSPNWGHSPVLYKAFGTSYQDVEETDPVKRIAKAAALANNPRTAQIRACYRNVKGLANCVTCKKCVRTRLEFELVQAKYRPIGLEKKPTTAELLREKLTNWDYLYYLEALTWARKKGFPGTFKPLVAVSYARLNTKLRLFRFN